MGSDVFKAVNI